LAISRVFEQRKNLAPVSHFCRLSSAGVDWRRWSADTFPYYEIGGLSAHTGEAISSLVAVHEAPSRAKYLVKEGDLLVSTVRVNLKAIAQVPVGSDGGVASSGFAVLRAPDPATVAYVRACLLHDAGTQQLMRWNTGGAYPAIDRSVVLDVLVPNPGEDQVLTVGHALLTAQSQLVEADRLVTESRSDIERLVEGTCDTEALVAAGQAAEEWFSAHPSPHDKGGP
jgi:type I restriction enzyme S subunit